MKIIMLLVLLLIISGAISGSAEYIDGILVEPYKPPPSNARQLTVIDSFPASGGNYSMGLAFDGKNLWNDEAFRHWFADIDTSTGAVIDSFFPSFGNRDMAFDGQFLWATDWQQERVYKYDTATCAILTSFPAPFAGKANGMAWDGTNMWIGQEGGQLWYCDTSGTVIRSIPAPNSTSSNPRGLAFDGTYLWVGAQTAGMIYEVDPSDGTVINTYVSPCANLQQGLAFDGTYLWATGGFNWIYQLDIGLIGIFEVTEFYGIPGKDYVRLLWKTEEENRSYQWIIKRKDLHSDYITIGVVEALGYSTKPHTYEFTDRNASAGKQYAYLLTGVDLDGHRHHYGPLHIDLSGYELVPHKVQLSHYPNPCDGRTTVCLGIPLTYDNSDVHLGIYDAAGRLLRTLGGVQRGCGYYSVNWDGRDADGRAVEAGIYFLCVRVRESHITRKIVVINQ
jgi:hypothetical protein